MDLFVVRQTAEALMREHGLIDNGWKFGFNDNVWRAGVCRHRTKSVELSRHYCQNNPETEIRDTILHEMAHALVGPGHGHDQTWKRKCVEIGARPQRCYDSKIVMPQGKWVGQCPNCKQVFRRHRRPKVLTGWWHKGCGKTAGSFEYSRESS